MQMVNKKRDVAIFISDIMGLKLKTVIRDKKGHCMIINGLIHQEDITNIPALNIGDPKYMKKNINSSYGRSRQAYNYSRRIQYPIFNNRQIIQKKVNKEVAYLNNIIDQMNLDIYRIFHSTVAEYILFLSTQRKFSSI